MTATTSDTALQTAARLQQVRIKGRGSGPMGPHTFLAERQEALDALEWHHIGVTPQCPTIGAEITGVDLSEVLADATIDELRRALCAHKVLVFRDQHLTSSEQLVFARRFGELEVHPFLTGSDEAPELVRLAKDAVTGGYENIWHSDVSWRERPALGSVLRAIEVPAVGGDTLFADMGAALGGLRPETQEQIADLVAVHDFVISFGQALDGDALDAARREYPAVEHPVVRTHPETGERLLYVNAIFTSHIVGMPEADSEALLRRLFRQAEIPEYQFRLRWEPGTVAFWDNRATQHYANSDYWPRARSMERAAITGDRPI